MQSLSDVIARLPARPEPAALLQGFVPPPRFADKRFDDYEPQHPTQRAALERLQELAGELNGAGGRGIVARLRAALAGSARAGGGTYLDGGFGVGKTHLLAALWHAAEGRRAFVSFDELMYLIGLLGVGAAVRAFHGYRLVAVDEWELDDPGNLKMALAWLRGVVADGVHVAVTSNTLPLELGEGRFSQKDFASEIEELAAVFEVVRVEGEDYRHRHFEADPGRGYFVPEPGLRERARAAGPEAVLEQHAALLSDLERVHPIRYAAVAERVPHLLVADLRPVARLPDALRWVHFVDTLYDNAVPLAASATIPLSALFPPDFLAGPYAKKMSRCLSRMEEMLGADAPNWE